MTASMTSKINLMLGDCLERMKEIPDGSVDAIVTDPPYGLSFMGKDWDKGVPGVHFWEEMLRVLKPGGHLLSFAGTRTHHRMAVNIEDAGFEIRDMIAWVYSTGFPKSHNFGCKCSRDGREVPESDRSGASCEPQPAGQQARESGAFSKQCGSQAGGMAADKRCQKCGGLIEWQGWGTALKPALEPISVCRKPFPGTVAANVQQHGTSALNIDACRVAANGETPSGSGRNSKNTWALHSGSEFQGHTNVTPPSARWPANLIHDGSDEVVGLFPVTTSGKASANGHKRKNSLNYQSNVNYADRSENAGTLYGDSGSAARFFYCAKASKSDRDEGCVGMIGRFAHTMGNGIGGKEHDPETATPKRNHHPTVKPTRLMRYLVRLVTPPGGTVLDPFMGSGSTGKAAVMEGFEFIGIEMDEEYFNIAMSRINATQYPT
jgi:DNA modification methylase